MVHASKVPVNFPVAASNLPLKVALPFVSMLNTAVLLLLIEKPSVVSDHPTLLAFPLTEALT